ncbi:MAG: DUF4149 domain-containing protein [Planctomycetota bacterium]|nr:DUF4149 domain-containing protein [Planctomycetota bacterium]MEE2660733.1 DUF4149 domain-containing protein [Planctomycetota bacterium]
MNTFVFLSGIAVGIILFQSALIAPTVLKTLDAKATSNFLRAIWPKFFVVLSVIGGAAAIAFWKDDIAAVNRILAFLLVGLPVFAYAIIPATNRAADREDHARFKVLHRLSVLTTLALLADYFWLALT